MKPEALQTVALAVAAERSLDRILAHIVDGLVTTTGVALARVWLIAPRHLRDLPPSRGMSRPDALSASGGQRRQPVISAHRSVAS
jgi:hypothetical protein